MKKTFIILIGALCIVAASATMAAANTTAPRSAARSTMAGASSASSGFAPKCPPFAVVAKALALTLSGGPTSPTKTELWSAITQVKAPACRKRTSNGSPTKREPMFPSDQKFDKSLRTAVGETSLGTGSSLRGPLHLPGVPEGMALCTIKAEASVAHLEVLATELLSLTGNRPGPSDTLVIPPKPPTSSRWTKVTIACL